MGLNNSKNMTPQNRAFHTDAVFKKEIFFFPFGLKFVFLTMILLVAHLISFSQTVNLRGIVKDENTLKPIREVNIKVYTTNQGTYTDGKGTFSLTLKKTPAMLVISCVGYENSSFNIKGDSKDPVEILLTPKSYTLQEFDVTSKNYSYLFKDKDYSVLDYELMNDHVLLLIFRNQIKRSELVLLTNNGDTLAISKLPEGPPASLYKDFLLNVHYFSKEQYSYQCFYNKTQHQMEFGNRIRVDSLLNLFAPFLFKMSDRLYLQEKRAYGLGTAIGYYATSTGKKYIRQYFNEKKLAESIDDQKFYASWNSLVGEPLYDAEVSASTFAARPPLSIYYDRNEAGAHQFEFYNMIYPVVKTGEDSMAFFNFSDDVIELMDKNGQTIGSVPITFQKGVDPNSSISTEIKLSEADWRWGSNILVDEYSHFVYTTFLKNGMVKIRKINLNNGNLSKGAILPYPFPEKIEIYKGEAYFLIKRDGINDNWKLVKCRL
jgi:hypothetical protein